MPENRKEKHPGAVFSAPGSDCRKSLAEFRPYLESCRFVGCSHTREKGCAVLAAVKEGTIPKSRHDSYLRLRQELKDLRSWNQKEIK